MSSTATIEAPSTTPAPRRTTAGTAVNTFLAVFSRDLFVTSREIGPFLVQTLIQPLFILFILGKVLVLLSFANPNFGNVLLPGILAMIAFITALQNTTLPIVIEFSWTMEIEDRLLAPMPIWMVAVEKIVYGALRGVLAALVMVPVGFLIIDGVHWEPSGLAPAFGVLVLGSLLGAAIGMVLGTLVPPRHIQVMFALALVPLSYTGSAQFPWRLLEALPWFQVVCAFNPLTYMCESMRSLLLAPGSTPSIPLWINLLAMFGCLVVFGAIGIRGFTRRARN